MVTTTKQTSNQRNYIAEFYRDFDMENLDKAEEYCREIRLLRDQTQDPEFKDKTLSCSMVFLPLLYKHNRASIAKKFVAEILDTKERESEETFLRFLEFKTKIVWDLVEKDIKFYAFKKKAKEEAFLRIWDTWNNNDYAPDVCIGHFRREDSVDIWFARYLQWRKRPNQPFFIGNDERSEEARRLNERAERYIIF